LSVTGPYLKKIFVDELKAGEECVINAKPLEDFGGLCCSHTFIHKSTGIPATLLIFRGCVYQE